MSLSKVDIAVLILHSCSAGILGLILLRYGVVGAGSAVTGTLAMLLFLGNVLTIGRVVRRAGRK